MKQQQRPAGFVRSDTTHQPGWIDMKADSLARMCAIAPGQERLLALETQLAQVRQALAQTPAVNGVHELMCTASDSAREAAPRRGRGRPPKFSMQQRQFLALEAQFAKLRGALEDTLTAIDMQKGLGAL
jgi:capsule polysaccharide export protein KpsE/RkpR